MSLKFIEEYRNADVAQKYSEQISALGGDSYKIMEACGGQTHSIIKYGIDRMLPDGITLVHGPGCPVCVTPMSTIDAAIQLSLVPKVILCTFGDMIRVPGSETDLQSAKADGADVRIVYSPTDALTIARQNPDHNVVFFAVGFETTAPANAMVAYQAHREGLRNFSMLVSQVLVPPAIDALLSSENHELSGFLAPGHVCTITGFEEYEVIVKKYHIPIVVTGFEPTDILQGLLMCLRQLKEGRCEIENQYTRSVQRQGNGSTQAMLGEVFEVVPKVWRGLGSLPNSGLQLAEKYRDLDARHRFCLGVETSTEKPGCISGLILQGIKKPSQCPMFGKGCSPERPLGATMVSSEGACAAYYRYRREEC